MIVCIKDILLLINIEHVINIHKEKDLDNVLSVPLKTKTNKEFMEARDHHACMRRFLETVKRPVEFAFKYHSSINPAWCSMKISLQRMPFKKAL
jgi:hypothetical protein